MGTQLADLKDPKKGDDIEKSSEKSSAAADDVTDEQLYQTLNNNFSASQDAFAIWRHTLDEKERLLYGRPKEREENSDKANVNDPRLFSQTFERSIRVMSQLSTGKFKGVSSDDIGKNMLMNLTVDRYVIPNANSQFNFLTKLRVTDWYSLGYGSMIAITDWVVSDNYIGPDLFLIPIRNIYPQPGVPFADMDWCQIVSQVSLDFIKSRKSMDGWKNIDKFLEKVQDTTGDSPKDKDADEQSLNDKTYNSAASNTKKFPRFDLRTEYRRDKWITYSPTYELILREITNPHENKLLPTVVKYCIPLLDFAFGISEIEVSSSLADVINSLYNLAIDDAKKELYPPLVIDPDSVVLSSIRYGAAQKWLLNGKNSRAPEAFHTSSRGAQSALDIRQMAVGSLQSLAGSTDTTVKTGEEYSMGKTPQALKMQEARQSARDEIDRFYMERFITDVYSRFANLIVKKMPKAIILRLFKHEIEKIASTYPDILELVDKKAFGATNTSGKLKIDVKIPKDFFKGYQFDYEITPGSTYKIDQQTQAQNLQFILEMAQNKSIQEALALTGKRLDIPETISRLLTNSGIQDPDKILVDDIENPQAETQPNTPNPALNPQDEQLLAQLSPPQQSDDPNQQLAVGAQVANQSPQPQQLNPEQMQMLAQAQATPPITLPSPPLPQTQRDPQITQLEALINQR